MASGVATTPSCARGLVQRRPPVAVSGHGRPRPGQSGRPEHGTNGSFSFVPACSCSCAGQLAIRSTSTLEAVQHIEQGIPVYRAAACPPARRPCGCTRPHTARPQAYVRRPRTFAARGAGQHCYPGQEPGPAPSPANPGSALLLWQSAELMARLAPLPRHPSCSGLGDLLTAVAGWEREASERVPGMSWCLGKLYLAPEAAATGPTADSEFTE